MERFSAERVIHDFQDDAVIRGLAVQSGILSGRYRDNVLIDITYSNIYVTYESEERERQGDTRTWRGLLLKKNEPIPTRRSGVIVDDGRALRSGAKISVFLVFGDFDERPPSERDRLTTILLEDSDGPLRVGLGIDIEANRTMVMSLSRFLDGGTVHVQLNNFDTKLAFFPEPVVRATKLEPLRVELPPSSNSTPLGYFWRGFDEADLQGEDFRGQDLTSATFKKADLRRADLREACLRNADLSGADLREADLRDADLSGADFREAYLQGAKLEAFNWRSCLWKGAFYDSTTSFSADRDPADEGLIDTGADPSVTEPS